MSLSTRILAPLVSIVELLLIIVLLLSAILALVLIVGRKGRQIAQMVWWTNGCVDVPSVEAARIRSFSILFFAGMASF